jgi:glutathione S-transferase
MRAKLYAIPGSHPVKTGILMLQHKGIEVTRTDIPPALSRALLRGLGFAGTRVPAVKLDGRRVQGTRALSRALEELRPDPPLFPSDPQLRARVEEAELWGDEVLQEIPRRLSFSSPIRRNRSDFESFFEGRLLGMSPRMAMATAAPLLAVSARLNGATDDAVRADLAALPDVLDRIDALIDEGVIGGDQRNAADFQLAASVRLLLCFEDVRPFIEGRPAERHAREVVSSYPGYVRAALPAEWLAPLRAGAG